MALTAVPRLASELLVAHEAVDLSVGVVGDSET